MNCASRSFCLLSIFTHPSHLTEEPATDQFFGECEIPRLKFFPHAGRILQEDKILIWRVLKIS